MNTHNTHIIRFASPMSWKKNPLSFMAASMAGFALVVGLTTDLRACMACNLTFTDEVMSARAGTPVGRDLQRAMDNQRGLPLDAFGAYGMVLAANAAADSDTAPAPAPAPATRTVPLPAPAPAPAPASNPPRTIPDYMKNADFIEIIQRDYALNTPPTSYVPQDAPVDKSFTITLHEGKTYIGNGVVYDGFLTDGGIPGPTIIVNEGDIVEFNVVNEGNIPHGASIHAAYTQTSKYLGSIGPGQTKSVRFKATYPGVFMYHCAPGGHAIPMHVLFGQYGMMVVRPKEEAGPVYQLEKDLGHEPDLELFMIQHELYASGKDAIDGNAAYTVFNGRLFRYVEEPISVKPGDYVRMYFLNIGPNLLSTFHIVGIIWDYVYWQGHPDAMWPGGQSVTAGPTDSWIIEFRIPPEEGAYTMLSHAVGSTSRGAIGLLVADANADVERGRQILAEGPLYSEEEMALNIEQAQRIISPFRIGTSPADRPVVFGPETEEVNISIIGNSYHPKVVQVAPGTKITWTNEDVFTYLAGEYSGIHNAAATSSPEDSDGFVSPLLAHGESHSEVLEVEGEYTYICTPHPYMQARIIVKEPEYSLAAAGDTRSATLGVWVFPLLGVCLLISTVALVRGGRRNPS